MNQKENFHEKIFRVEVLRIFLFNCGNFDTHAEPRNYTDEEPH